MADDEIPPPPPAAAAPPPPPPPPGGLGKQEARAQVAADKARAKAMRPWYKKKRFVIPLALVAVIVVASLAGGGAEDEDKRDEEVAESGGEGATGGEEANDPDDLFGARPDKKEDDKERQIGGSAELSGYTATVTASEFQQELSQFETDGYLVTNVSLLNRDDEAQSYNTFEWKLITPGGRIIDPYLGGDQLGSGDLAGDGGKVEGLIIFEIGDEKGDYYVIYDPSDFGDERAVWKTTI